MAGQDAKSAAQKGETRRSALAQGAAGTLYCGATMSALARASPLAAALPISVPDKPMRLSRVLTRELRGFEKLRVARDWQVEFAEHGGGIAITGRQLSARVYAPPAISEIARIEENRNTDSLFPIMLSGGGIILAAGPSTRKEDLDFAVLKAQSMIAAAALPENEKAQHLQYIAQLQRGGASFFDQLPPDLFFPDKTSVRSQRGISLPGGMRGEFEMTYQAYTNQGEPWLLRAVREVVTRIGTEERRSAEEWVLEPLGNAVR